MKKLICLFLALGVLFSLAACQVDTVIGPEEVTTKRVGEDDLAGAIGQLNLDPGALEDEAMKAALQRMLEQGVTLPVDEPPPETMPPPMPTGVPIRAEDVYPLMEKTRDIFNSGTYTFKARGSSPPSPGMPIGTTPITFAVDKGQSAFEAQMDWTSMARAMAEPGTQEYSMAVINGATMTTFFGKKVRFVTKPEGSVVLFLDKKSYFAMPGDEEGGESAFGIGNMFGDMFKPDTQGTVTASKVTDGGKEYLCGETKSEGGQLFYYFLDGQLKRIEMKVLNPEEGKTETFVFEVDLLTNTVDASMFSTAGYKPITVDEFTQMGEGGLSGLFGG